MKYQHRMKQIWDKMELFEVTEQQLADQAKAIRVNKMAKRI